MPLLLLAIAEDAGHENVLAMPAAFGLLTSLANALLGPAVGALVDRCRSRARPVALAAGATGACVGAGGLVMCALPAALGGHLWLVVAAASAFGAAESLASMVAMVALSRDWVPLLCEERAASPPRAPSGEASPLLPPAPAAARRREAAYNGLLTRVNAAVSTVNLLGETVAPLAAGLLLAVASSFRVRGVEVGLGGAVVAGVGTLTPLLAGAVLVRCVCGRSAALRGEREPGKAGEERPRTSLLSSWLACVRHEYGVALIVFAYSALYLSALSSHGILLTAFLKAEGTSPTVLGAFRGAGALSGVLGVSLFPRLVARTSLRSASTAYIGLLVLGVAAATAAYVAGHGGVLAGGREGAAYTAAFMATIVLSRAGLYGYEVGLMQHQQLLVDEKNRSAIGGFENALCNLATISLYGLGIVLGRPAHFGLLVLTGMCAVTTSLLLYLAWRYLWPESYHTHDDAEGGGHAHHHHDHAHIAQDERTRSSAHHHHPVRRAKAAGS